MKTCAFLIACVAVACADEVTLKSGGKVSGIVEEKDGKVVIRTEHGTVAIPRDQVAKIDRTKTSVLQDYDAQVKKSDLTRLADLERLLAWVEERKLREPAKDLRDRMYNLKSDTLDRSDPAELEAFAAWAASNGFKGSAELAIRTAFGLRRESVGKKDAEKLYELGLWAKSKGLAADALVLFQDVITLKPDHEFARRALGYELHQGKWMTSREVKQAMGLIEFEGDWMTPGAKEAILTARTLEKERKALEGERRKIEALREAQFEEFKRQMASLDARAAEIDRRYEEARRRADRLRIVTYTQGNTKVTTIEPW